jgi:hypothetical protein
MSVQRRLPEVIMKTPMVLCNVALGRPAFA